MALHLHAGHRPHVILLGPVESMDPELRFEIERLKGSVLQTVHPESLSESELAQVDCLVILKGTSFSEAMRIRFVNWVEREKWSGLFVKSGTRCPPSLWKVFAGSVAMDPSRRGPALRLAPPPVKEASRIRQGAFVLDPGNHTATIAGEEIVLRPMEYLLLSHFLEHPQRLHHRHELVDVLWGSGAAIDPRTVDVHVARLRKALGEKGCADTIETVFRFGYRFRPERCTSPKKLSES